jgi:surface antigen
LISCSNNPNKQEVGTVTGGIAGGLIGSQFGGGVGQLLAIGGGTLVGALIGGSVGKNMDETDRLKTQQAMEQTPTGDEARWKNPHNGTHYILTPTKNYQNKGISCRKYTMSTQVKGKTEKIHGTACRHKDGSWQTQ